MDRLNGVDPFPAKLWPTDFTIEHCERLIKEYHEEWLGILDRLSESDLDKIINYKTSMGDDYHTSVSDILAHVINHGTHTRAQAGQQLKFTGTGALPITDYSYYLRQLNS
jgi:uncharacterized damage-inducible protein DinB